jgi:serine phosphatase RsbU (regulator of sigma subunit)
MTAVVAHWDPSSNELRVANCGHVAPLLLHEGGEAELLEFAPSRGLGGRSTPKPAEQRCRLESGDRMLIVSDGVVSDRDGGAGIGLEATIEAALRSRQGSASDTVREVHRAVLAGTGGSLADDATAVCLAAG